MLITVAPGIRRHCGAWRDEVDAAFAALRAFIIDSP